MPLPAATPYQPTPKERKALKTRGLLQTDRSGEQTFYKIGTTPLKERIAQLLISEATVNSRAEFDQKAISVARFATEIVGITDDDTWTDAGIEWAHKAIKAKLATNPNNSYSVQHSVRATGTWLVRDDVYRNVDGEGLVPMMCWALTANVTLLNALDIVPRKDAMLGRVTSHQRVDKELLDRVPATKPYVLAANMLRLEAERTMFEEQRAALTSDMDDGERRQLLAAATSLYEEMNAGTTDDARHGAA